MGTVTATPGRRITSSKASNASRALRISTDELLGVKAPKVERIHDDSEARRTWKRFQVVASLPERDQKAVIRLINSLATVSAGKPRTGEAIGLSKLV
jgi:hypothetical protein